jgi:tetratricopeptide (TPR) repeat protein
MWAVKLSQSRSLLLLERYAEAQAAAIKALLIDPTSVDGHLLSALCHLQLEQEADARVCIQTVRRLAEAPEQIEDFWRRILPNSPTLEADIATIRALYAATEPGA